LPNGDADVAGTAIGGERRVRARRRQRAAAAGDQDEQVVDQVGGLVVDAVV
jgi:hypothetical protein